MLSLVFNFISTGLDGSLIAIRYNIEYKKTLFQDGFLPGPEYALEEDNDHLALLSGMNLQYVYRSTTGVQRNDCSFKR